MYSIPLYIIHGQLGAGKTTILKSLIMRSEFRNVRIIENEFAGHSVDGGRLHEDHPELGIYEISGACVCCTGSDALMSTLINLADSSKEEMPVVIETTGAVDAAKLLRSLLLSPEFHKRFTLKANILVVDALTALKKAEYLERLRADIVLADLVVLTKGDLLGPGEVEKITRTLEGIAGSKLVISDHGTLPNSVRFDGVRSEAEDGLIALSGGELRETHEDLSWVAFSPSPCTTGSLIEALSAARAEGAEILRIKGTMNDPEGNTWRIDGTEYFTESVLSTVKTTTPKIVLIGRRLPRSLQV